VLPLGDRNVFGPTVRQHADVVDHDVVPAEPPQCRVPNAVERVRIRDVGAPRQCVGTSVAQVAGEGPDRVVVDVDGDLIAKGIHAIVAFIGSQEHTS
jgi:hypothetical protein